MSPSGTGRELVNAKMNSRLWRISTARRGARMDMLRVEGGGLEAWLTRAT
jgi:hypothetical protein